MAQRLPIAASCLTNSVSPESFLCLCRLEGEKFCVGGVIKRDQGREMDQQK